MYLLHLLRSLPYLPLRPNGAPPAAHGQDISARLLDKRLAVASSDTSFPLLPTGTAPLSILLPPIISPTNLSLPSSSTTLPFLTIVTPSPSASPILITSQSQLITSYIPVLTACPLSASGFPPLFNKRNPQIVPNFPRPSPPIASGSLLSGPLASTNYSLPGTATGTGFGTGTGTGAIRPTGGFPSINLLSSTTLCSTSYSPTITPICHTTLTPLGGVPILVSACDQVVAFSTGLGVYTSSVAAGAGNASGVEVLLPTTYSAPWDSVITGVPLAPVVGVFCPVGLGVCSSVTESWYTEVVGTVGRTTSGVEVAAVVAGPSEIFVPPFIQTSIPAGKTMTISIDTTYTLAYSTSATVVVQETFASTTTVTSTSTSVRTVTLAAGALIPTLG